MSAPSLPVDAVLPELLAALAEHRAAVLCAPTGAGKTTRVPPALLDGGLAGDGVVVVLEPRRLAARAVARRMAVERGGRVGGEVGYRVRFDRAVGPETRIEVVTEGLFVRQLQEDPWLARAGAVVLDEFHERHLESDLAFAMLRKVRRELRPELPLVVMSATLATEEVAAALGDCPVVRSEGRLHPVQVRYLPRPDDGPLHERVALGVRAVAHETPGDVLVFLPGVGEIRRAARELDSLAQREGLSVLELYGDLPAAQQDAVLEPGPRRKLILATNVAETSLTIPGVTAVVDSGLVRQLRSDPALGLDRLERVTISRASAEQRAGRAGRTAPGVCARLWTENEHRALAEHDTPDIQRVDLAGPMLQLLAWGESDLAAFPWLQPPPEAATARALALLKRLGAVGEHGITAVGRALARLPVHPRLGRLLWEAHRMGHGRRAALAAALLSERTRGVRGGRAERSRSDVLDRVVAFESADRGRGSVDRGTRHRVGRARDQLARHVDDLPSDAGTATRDGDEALLRGLLAAFPDRVAVRRAPGERRGVMVGGRGVRLADESAVRDAALFVCVEVDGGGRGQSEAIVRQASAVEREWLDVTTATEARFDPRSESVVARHVTRYDDLVLEEVPAERPDPARAAEVLAQAAASDLDRALDLADPDLQRFFARIACLSEWMPELELPAMGEETLRALLPTLCMGRRSFRELRRASLVDGLRGVLSPPQMAALDRHAPDRLQVPSGSRLALSYEPGRAPVLAVRIQEMFGVAETPRVGGGRVPVVLHLLAPNMRAQQVTDDLSGFWSRTYPGVRRELRRRYPKHDWPEDPLAAAPSRGARRRKRT